MIKEKEPKPNKYDIDSYKESEGYFAHSIKIYNSTTERLIIDNLKNAGFKKIINPKNLDFHGDMTAYLKFVVDNSKFVIFYKDTIGVVAEVLTAKFFNIPVFTIDLNPISDEQLKAFANKFLYENSYIGKDLNNFERVFHKSDDFVSFLKGVIFDE